MISGRPGGFTFAFCTLPFDLLVSSSPDASPTQLQFRQPPCTIKIMRGPRPSLAWKIATANILLALFAVLLAGMLQYRKERRILAATMRQELAQVGDQRRDAD